jgi:hypothetical protein
LAISNRTLHFHVIIGDALKDVFIHK